MGDPDILESLLEGVEEDRFRLRMKGCDAEF
jgi:hypothetical protein